MASSKEVVIGGTKHTVQRFRGLKAIMAMASLTRIAREVPDIMADAVKAYQERNTVVVTEPMARLPRWQSFTTEDFDAAEKSTGKRQIELPTPMTANEQVLYALPELLQKARKEVTRLLALMIISNEDLKEADQADKVEDALDKFEDILLYEAELDELVDLAFATQDVIAEQLQDRKDRLGKLLRSLWTVWRTNQQVPQTPELPSSEQITEVESTQQTSTPDAPTSSTNSPEPTDGVERPVSMVSPG